MKHRLLITLKVSLCLIPCAIAEAQLGGGLWAFNGNTVGYQSQGPGLFGWSRELTTGFGKMMSTELIGQRVA